MSSQLDNTGRSHGSDPAKTERADLVVLASVLFVVAAAGLALARNGGPPFVDILYAEDGTVFFTGAEAQGLGAVATAYAGYLHVVPRVVSGLIAILPVGIDAISAAYAVTATVLVAVLALYTYFASRVLLDSWASRAILAGAMILPPVAGQTVANLTNLHWYLMFAAFWAVISRPRNAAWTIAAATIGAAAALSDPLTALLLPSAALAVHHYRSRRHGLVVAAMVAGLAIQAIVALGAEQRIGAASSWADLPVIYALRVAGGIAVGDVHLTSVWQRVGWYLPVVAIAAAIGVVALAIALTRKWRRVIVVASAFNSMLFLAVPLLVRGTEGLVPVAGVSPPLHSGRYFLSPFLFLVLCVAVLVDRAVIDQTRTAVVIGGIAVVWLVTVSTANYVIAPLPNGPSWEAGVEAARAECAAGQLDAVEVTIAPRAGWRVPILCTDL